MDFKFSKGSSDTPQQESTGEKKNQNALLVLFLLLVGGFSYIYFFTDLIKPQEVLKPTEAPAPQVVKMPLPLRDGDAAKVPAPQPAKPKEEPKKPEPAKPADNKTLPAPVAEKKEQKAVAAKVEEKMPVADKKQAPADKKVEPVRPADKKGAVKGVIKPKKSVAAALEGAWSVLVGHYVLEEALSADMGRVRKAGLVPVVKAGARKKTTMNRLLFSEFTDRAEAQAAVDKLKRHTSDVFIIDRAGKHAVYAGSYLLDARAATEKERLAAAGFSVTLKRIEIAIPSQSLTVGPFSSKIDADAVLSKLKGTGVKATLIHQ